MTSEANAYAFAYSTDIINVPLDHSAYDIVDERIPFYEMIIHGCIDYSSELLNFENRDELQRELLLLIESGAAPHYVFTREESGRMKETALNRLYATTFENWAEPAAESYRFVSGALDGLQDVAITDHEILDQNLRRVSYANGVRILINYGDEEAQCEGRTVPALSYIVEE